MIVDDAHLDPERLVRLRRIRKEVGSEAALIATAWPGSEGEVAEVLALPSSRSIRTLKLLTRKQILEVLRAIGIDAPDDDPYLGVLVDQAANKPGLAVTLGSLWLRGEWRGVLTGKAIQRTLIPALKRVLESDPSQLLACFALGGDAGMSLEAVADFLRLSRDEAYRRAVHASHGGMLRIGRDKALVVEPEALRSALFGDVFFPPPNLPALPYRNLLEQAPSPAEAVETLVRARLRGAPVPEEDLRLLLEEHPSTDSLALFARLGESEGRWVLENYPDRLVGLAWSLLEAAPRPAIRKLLEKAATAEGSVHANYSHPLRVLQEWVQGIPFVPGGHGSVDLAEAVARRRRVVEEARSYLQAGRDRTVGLCAIFFALSPRMEESRDSSTGDSVRMHAGILPSNAVPEVLDLWEEVRDVVIDFTRESWEALEEMLTHWVYPDVLTLGQGVPEETATRLRAVPMRILHDLQPLATERPGLQWELAQWAERLGISLAMPLDPDFCVLFPSDEHLSADNYQAQEEEQRRAARDLAELWASRPPEEAVSRLAFYEREGETFGHRQTEALYAFYEELAKEAEFPERWLRCLLDGQLSALAVAHFLSRVVEERGPGWRELVGECLGSAVFGALAAREVVCAEGMAEDLIESALRTIRPDQVSAACQRDEVPPGTIRSLLTDPNGQTRLAAAVGMWLSDPRGQIEAEMSNAWRQAVVSAGEGGGIDHRPAATSVHWLKDILKGDPDLAFEWLFARLDDARGYEAVGRDGVYCAAANALNLQDRRRFLETTEPSHLAGS